jgi:hypothetical protein
MQHLKLSGLRSAIFTRVSLRRRILALSQLTQESINVPRLL